LPPSLSSRSKSTRGAITCKRSPLPRVCTRPLSHLCLPSPLEWGVQEREHGFFELLTDPVPRRESGGHRGASTGNHPMVRQ
jgi:hypothetical protein